MKEILYVDFAEMEARTLAYLIYGGTMKHVYCSNCGMKLAVVRKALPKMARIIDVVDYHECTEEPAEITFEEVDIPTIQKTEGKDKFVQNLNDLARTQLGQISTDDLRDRRANADVKSLAPESVLKNLTSEQVSDVGPLEEE